MRQTKVFGCFWIFFFNKTLSRFSILKSEIFFNYIFSLVIYCMYKYEESFFLSILQTKENKNYTFFVRTKPFRPENDLTIGLINIAVSINQVFHSSLFSLFEFLT